MNHSSECERELIEYITVCESALKNLGREEILPDPCSLPNLRANFPEPELDHIIGQMSTNREALINDIRKRHDASVDRDTSSSFGFSGKGSKEISRRAIIKTLVYLNSKIFLDTSGKLPTPEDAIFPVKNSLVLADDFVPRELMVMVEGSNDYDAANIIRNIQPFPPKRSLLGLGGDEDGKIKKWKYLVPLGFPGDKEPGKIFNSLMEFFEVEISKMESSPWYSNFIFGRITRSVVYQLSRKNKRILTPPLFPDYYIKILSDHDLVDLDRKPPEIRKDRDLDSLRNINQEAEKLSSMLAEKWLDENIQIPSGILW